jgi:lysozyme
MHMATPNRKVLDISHHNEVTSWSQMKSAGIVGVIGKATEGAGYTDPDYVDRARDALNAGLLWGAYHFATGSTVKTQVDDFLSVTGVDDETLYALDWEDNPGGTKMSLDQAREFLERIGEEIGPNRCVVYSGNTAKEALDDREDDFFGAHPLWLAQYSSSPVPQPSWEDYWLWQYSDGNYGPGPHGCPGVSGDVDTNSFDGTDDELRDQWSGTSPRPPRPPRPPLRTPVVRLYVPRNSILLVNGRLVELPA